MLTAIFISLMVGMILRTCLMYTVGKVRQRKALKYDVHKVRELEYEIWGEYYTPPPKPKEPLESPRGRKPYVAVKATPSPALNEAPRFTCVACGEKKVTIEGRVCSAECSVEHMKANSRPRTCQRCEITLSRYSADTCASCTSDIQLERRVEREKKSFGPRVRTMEYKGEMYRTRMPSEVPDNAHVAIMETYKHGDFFGTWFVFKWTDEKTGQQMHLKTVANQVSLHEIRDEAMNGAVKRYYA